MGATPIDDNVADGNLANRNIRLISVDYTRNRFAQESKDRYGRALQGLGAENRIQPSGAVPGRYGQGISGIILCADLREMYPLPDRTWTA